MKKLKLLLSLLLFAMTAPAFAQTYFPDDSGGAWDSIAPDELGFCQDSIVALYDYLEFEKSKSFILLKDGKIVLEKYFGSYASDSLYVWYSAGKSLRAFLVGVAQEEGFLSISDKTSDYLGTAWTSLNQVQEDSITLWHQLTMTTGLDETEFFCTEPSCLTYKATAGTRWAYHNSPYSLLKDVLEEATNKAINTYTYQKVKAKTGMSGGFWLKIGYNSFYFSTARDMARFGLMIQNNGVWDGDTLLHDTAYMRQMVNSSQNINPSYGYLWWLNGKSSFIPPEIVQSFPGPIAPHAPSDMFTAAGAQGQFVSISPSNGYVLIRQGEAREQNLTSITILDGIWERVMRLSCTAGEGHMGIPAVRIYPNPSSETVAIEGWNKPNCRLYSTQGTLVLRQATNQLNLKSLPQGVYYLLMEQDGRYLRKMIVKQ